MEVELFSSQFFVALFSIIVLDLVLAGDNAVVIAMASNRLPAHLRNRAIYVGTAGAIVVRLIMTYFAV
ncbi:MAG: TerC family protein, partial [Selenomonas noxia]